MKLLKAVSKLTKFIWLATSVRLLITVRRCAMIAGVAYTFGLYPRAVSLTKPLMNFLFLGYRRATGKQKRQTWYLFLSLCSVPTSFLTCGSVLMWQSWHFNAVRTSLLPMPLVLSSFAVPWVTAVSPFFVVWLADKALHTPGVAAARTSTPKAGLDKSFLQLFENPGTEEVAAGSPSSFSASLFAHVWGWYSWQGADEEDCDAKVFCQPLLQDMEGNLRENILSGDHTAHTRQFLVEDTKN